MNVHFPAAHVWAILALSATILPSHHFGVSASACSESKGRAETTMSQLTCGQQYSHSCTICMEDYDGEGAEAATCSLDYEICDDTGVCGVINTSGVWKAALSLYTDGVQVTFTKGLQGSVFYSMSYNPRSGGDCAFHINEVSCKSCVLIACDSNPNSLAQPFADCTNLGEGTFDRCDKTNFGSPGVMIQAFERLPSSCGSGGQAGNAASATGAVPQEVSPILLKDAQSYSQNKPTSLATTHMSYMHYPLGFLTIGVLVLG